MKYLLMIYAAEDKNPMPGTPEFGAIAAWDAWRDTPIASGPRTQLGEFAFADHGRRGEPCTLLRNDSDHLKPQCVDQSAQLIHVRGVLGIVDVGQLHSHEHCGGSFGAVVGHRRPGA